MMREGKEEDGNKDYITQWGDYSLEKKSMKYFKN